MDLDRRRECLATGGVRVGVTGVRRILDNAADTAVFRPAYAAGFLVGNLVGGVALILLGRKWSR